MVATRATIRGLAGIAAVCVVTGHAWGQSRLLGPFKPMWLQHASLLRHYLCTDAYGALSHTGHDRDAVDSLFAHAMMIADNNIGDALLAAAVACFDHPSIGIKLGIVTLPVPLSVEDDSLFTCARSHLPAKLFFDSPPEGDRDKLQHFFGSAYLQWITNSNVATGIVGNGIELLEPGLVVGGTDDPRDVRADKAGQAFAILIGNYYYVAPSVILEMVR